jgi:FtsP/CotA-like multicopper oxidase with cupredoxin domain
LTRNTRIALLAAAVVVAVGAFVIAQSGGDDNDDNGSQASSATQTTKTTQTKTAAVTVLRLALKDAEPVGGVKTLTATKGDNVRLVVSADAPDEVHLHGYDIEKEAEPGKPAVISFKANLEGAFELESHTAEHEGKEPLIARLHVEP